jgi:hypothetical protein
MQVSPLELFTRERRADRLGIKSADQLRLDWPAMISRKKEIVSNWSKSKNETLAKLGITRLRGHAAFTGAHEIAVAGRNYSADKFVYCHRVETGAAGDFGAAGVHDETDGLVKVVCEAGEDSERPCDLATPTISFKSPLWR